MADAATSANPLQRPANVIFAMEIHREEVIGLLHAMHAEVGYAESGIGTLSEAKCRELFDRSLDRTPGKLWPIIGIIDGPETIEGTICLCPCQTWFSDDWHL